MVYRGKELTDVAFEDPNGAGVIFRYLVGKGSKSIHRPVCPLPYTARVRVCYELFIEVGVQYPVECMMQQPVTHARLVDVAGFGVRNAEVVVAAMAVSQTY